MRMFGTITLLLTGLILFGSQRAWAVVDGEGSLVSKGVLAKTIRLKLPVSWQVTRARFVDGNATTQSESYRAEWTLEIGGDGRVFLESQHGRVPAYRTGSDLPAPNTATATGPQTQPMPKNLLVPEAYFAKLIGLIKGDVTTDVIEPVADRVVNIPLIKTQVAVNPDVNLNLSDDEHVAVHIEVEGTSY